MKIYYLILSLLFASVLRTSAQDFLNLDFEYNSYKAQPRKWVIEGEGEYYYAKVDSTSNTHLGRKSLWLDLKLAETYVFLSLPQDLVKGKTVRISGHVKSDRFDSLQVLLGFKDPQGGKPILTPLREPKNNNEWQLITNQTSISPDYSSDRLLVALIVIGSGTLNFDDVSLQINGIEIGKDKPVFSEPTKEELTALNNCAIPIQSLQSTWPLKDLEPLGKVIGNSWIVALGENSHGSSSIYQLKLRLVQYLVERKNYSLFVLESPTVEADIINEYVTENRGNINEVYTHLVYPSWKTQEMINIIEWIKQHNQTAKTKVQFRGCDMQDGGEALKKLQHFAQLHDKELMLQLDTLSADLRSNKKGLPEVFRQIENLENYMNKKSTIDQQNENILELKKYVLILKQSIGLKMRLKSRDEYMAENISWLLTNGTPNMKMIISADNSHITKATGKMGRFLQAKYPGNYLTFGFTFNTGTYSAYGEKPYYEVHPSYVGTYEYLFSKSKFDNYILDLRQPKINLIVNAPRGFRSIGSRPQETTQFSEITLSNHFDVIAYIKNSEHTVTK